MPNFKSNTDPDKSIFVEPISLQLDVNRIVEAYKSEHANFTFHTDNIYRDDRFIEKRYALRSETNPDDAYSFVMGDYYFITAEGRLDSIYSWQDIFMNWTKVEEEN